MPTGNFYRKIPAGGYLCGMTKTKAPQLKTMDALTRKLAHFLKEHHIKNKDFDNRVKRHLKDRSKENRSDNVV